MIVINNKIKFVISLAVCQLAGVTGPTNGSPPRWSCDRAKR
jgi:hypothetical protein